MIGEILERTDGTRIEIVSEPYQVREEDGAEVVKVLAVMLTGSSADQLWQAPVDMLEMSWKRA